MSAAFIPAAQVREGDTLLLSHSQHVTIERISEARCDGWIGLHANNETWSSWYKPTDRVRVRAARLSHVPK